jgi:hypothetical protein
VTNKIHCNTHGEADKAYVCTHLVGESTGLGFNRSDPTDDNPNPDAWCDNCELIRAAHGEWDDDAQKLTSISLLCSGCYERTRIRNERPTVAFDDLANLRWKCGDCDEWHTGPCLDLGYSEPHYWREELAATSDPDSFLTEDYCAVDGEYFFVRGLIHLPILGTGESFRWGVWGSLSRANFDLLRKADDDENRAELEPMFSWLSTRLPDYPDTLNLKMYAHIQDAGQRPHFRLEPSDHPLAQEYHHGISPERVKKIVRSRLPSTAFD